MKRKRGSDKDAYGEAWKNIADLLRLPSLRSNTEVLQFLEDNYSGLTMRHGPGGILTLRDIFEGGHMHKPGHARLGKNVNFLQACLRPPS